jgi:hypothetical protein
VRVPLGDRDVPAHGPPRVIDANAAVAGVRARDLDAPERAWLGRALTIDGTCTAHVVGFAVVGRIQNDRDTHDPFEDASPELAARLDGCRGLVARDAQRPPAVLPELVEDADLASRARAQVIASEASHEIQREWGDAPGMPRWQDQTPFDIRVLRHPLTGAMFVLVHAHRAGGCGEGTHTNLIAMFRVRADRSLHAIAIRNAELDTIDRVLDVDRDGTLELVGEDQTRTDTMLQSVLGTTRDRVHVPAFGCSC